MGIKIENYAEGFKYVSLALDEQTKKDLIEDELDFIFFDKKELFLLSNIICNRNAYNVIQSCI